MNSTTLKTIFLNKQTFFLLLPAIALFYFATFSFYYSRLDSNKLPEIKGKITALQNTKKGKRGRTALIIQINTEPYKFFKINSMSDSSIFSRTITPKIQIGDSVSLSTYPSIWALRKTKDVIKFSRGNKIFKNFSFIEKKISSTLFWIFSIPFLCLLTIYILLARKRLINNRL